jgi:cobalt-zinc-cadmium efflux system membrane fusion protein
MIKGILGWIFDHAHSKRLGLLAWIVMLSVIMSGVQCFKRATHSKQPPVPIVYAGDRLIIPEGSSVRSVVTIQAVQPQNLTSTLILPAIIQVIPANEVSVYAPLAGQVETIPQKLGSLVHKGDVLYTLVSPDFAKAIADQLNAESSNVLAQQTLKRQQELIQYNIGSMHNLQIAENDAAQARVELQRATARLAALHVDRAEQNPSGRLIVRSPVEGIVSTINSGIGSYWSDLTNPVMTVMDIRQVQAMAAIQESDIAGVSLGQQVSVTLDSNNKTYDATVSMMNPVLDPNTRTLGVGLLLNNPEYFLRPNMFARAKFKSKPRAMIVLPLTAVIQRGFDSIVFVEVAPWEFKARIVTVGVQMGAKIEIKSGLTRNERVATTGGIILND